MRENSKLKNQISNKSINPSINKDDNISKFDNLEQFNISSKEIIGYISFFAITASILYCYGFTRSLKFNLLNFITLQDYINISISIFVPLIIYLIVSIFPMFLLYPLIFWALRLPEERLKMKPMEIIILLIFFLISLYGSNELLKVLNYDTLINSNNKVDNIQIINNYFLTIYIFQLVFFMVLVVVTAYVVKIFNLTYQTRIMILVIPLYISLVIYFGFNDGKKIMNNELNQKNKIIVETKDKKLLEGRLILLLDKHLILKDNSNELMAIKSDNVNSIHYK